MHVMRTPLLLAAVALLLAACDGGRPTGIEPTTRIPPAAAPGLHTEAGGPVAPVEGRGPTTRATPFDPAGGRVQAASSLAATATTSWP
jgi:hypothetical protein